MNWVSHLDFGDDWKSTQNCRSTSHTLKQQQTVATGHFNRSTQSYILQKPILFPNSNYISSLYVSGRIKQLAENLFDYRSLSRKQNTCRGMRRWSLSLSLSLPSRCLRSSSLSIVAVQLHAALVSSLSIAIIQAYTTLYVYNFSRRTKQWRMVWPSVILTHVRSGFAFFHISVPFSAVSCTLNAQSRDSIPTHDFPQWLTPIKHCVITLTDNSQCLLRFDYTHSATCVYTNRKGKMTSEMAGGEVCCGLTPSEYRVR